MPALRPNPVTRHRAAARNARSGRLPGQDREHPGRAKGERASFRTRSSGRAAVGTAPTDQDRSRPSRQPVHMQAPREFRFAALRSRPVSARTVATATGRRRHRRGHSGQPDHRRPGMRQVKSVRSRGWIFRFPASRSQELPGRTVPRSCREPSPTAAGPRVPLPSRVPRRDDPPSRMHGTIAYAWWRLPQRAPVIFRQSRGGSPPDFEHSAISSTLSLTHSRIDAFARAKPIRGCYDPARRGIFAQAITGKPLFAYRVSGWSQTVTATHQ